MVMMTMTMDDDLDYNHGDYDNEEDDHIDVTKFHTNTWIFQ